MTSTVIIMVIALVNVVNVSNAPASSSSMLKITTFVNSLLFIIGILYCYFQNKTVDNSNFIERFILFSLPSMVRVIAITVVLGIVVGITQGVLQIPVDSLFTKMQVTGLGIGGLILSFLWISTGIIMIGNIKKPISKGNH